MGGTKPGLGGREVSVLLDELFLLVLGVLFPLSYSPPTLAGLPYSRECGGCSVQGVDAEGVQGRLSPGPQTCLMLLWLQLFDLSCQFEGGKMLTWALSLLFSLLLAKGINHSPQAMASGCWC